MPSSSLNPFLFPVNHYPTQVDAIGFDCYDNLTYYAQSLNNTCEEIFSFANEKGKIPLIGT